MEQTNINKMIRLVSVPVGISKKESHRNPVKYSKRKTNHNSKKVQNMSISQIQNDNGKESSYLNTNNHMWLKKKKSSKVSFKSP